MTTTVIIGEVVLYHINKAVYEDNNGEGPPKVNFERYQPLCRLGKLRTQRVSSARSLYSVEALWVINSSSHCIGGNTYGRVTSTFDLPRPDRSWQQKPAS